MRSIILPIFLFATLAVKTPAFSVPEAASELAIAGENKVPVKPEDLPEAIKSELAGDNFSDWKVSGAYLVTRENSSQYYEVNLRKGAETATLNFDKYGRRID